MSLPHPFHVFRALLAVCLLSLSSWASALTVKPYSAAELAQLQQAGKPVAVHFHADWCSTCKAQERSIETLRSDAQIGEVTLLVADYDNEKELRRSLKVRSQSVMVVFKGTQEVARLNGQTRPEDIKGVLVKAL
jgi:thioredoxin-like negative regulator of GroEL